MPKAKNKPLKLSPKRDQYTVVLEDIRSQNKVFGEALSFVHNDIKTLKGDVSNLKTGLSALAGDFKNFKDETRGNFKTVFNYLSKIDDELISIKAEIKELKTTLKDKVAIERVHILEIRVDKLERELAKR